MDKEVIEHELVQNSGNVVTVVRPFFGTQSDSWCGTLYSHSGDYPIKFEVNSIQSGFSTVFTADDVEKLDEQKDGQLVVRLKGPEVNPHHPSTIS